MSKRKFLIPLAVFSLLMSSLVACGGGTASSKPVGGSSGGQIDSSEPAGDTSSDVGGNSSSSAAGTSSQQQGSSSQQASSSQQQASSSQAGSSSQQGSSQQSADKSVTITECILMSDAGKAYVKVSGTQANYSAAEFKWAWGIKVNGDSGAFVDGKATPEDADYQVVAFDASNAFTVRYCLTDIANLTSGAFYRVYGGTPETYGDIAFTTAETGARDTSRSYYLRSDQNNSFVFDSVQPISFTKASVVNVAQADLPEGVTNAGAYLKFGGVNEAGITLDMLNEWHTAGKIAGNFQRVIGGYSKHDHVDAERYWKIEGNDVFFYCYIGFMANGEGWMTHFDLVSGNSGANLQFDNVIWGEEEYVIDGASYRVYADSSKSGESNFYGCLGVKREKWIDPSIHVHAYGDTPDHTNAATADSIKTDVYNCTGTCGTSVLRWSALDFDTTLSDSSLEKNADNVRFKSGSVENKGGTASTGSHIVYKVNVKAAQEKAGLAFRIKNTGGTNSASPVFKTISGDTSVGAIANADGTFTTATHRYGLRVNGVEYFLGDDDYGNQKSVTGWFDWPTEFPLQAGVNTIDVFAYAGYRANMYEFQLTGLPKYEETFEGYNATFTTEHCKVLVYSTKQYATETPVETNTCVAKDEEGNIVAYDPDDIELQPQVSFKVVCDAGYSCTVNNVTVTPTENYKNLKQNPDNKTGQEDIFRITKVKGDIAINIVAVQGEQAKGHKITFVATNCTVKVYIGPKNADGTNLDTPEDGVYYSRLKDSPYDIGFTTPQVNFEVVCDAGYEFTATPDENNKVDFITGDYNKFSDKGGYYNLTKITSDLTITITATAVGGTTPVEIAQPHGNFSGYAVNATDDSNIFVDVALGDEKAFIELGSDKLTSTYTFDKATGLVTIAIGGNYGNFTATYDEATNSLKNCAVDGAAAALLKNNGSLELVAAKKLWDCNGTTEELQAQFKRRYMSGSWQVDTSNADRFVSYAEGVSGSAMQRRGWTGGAVAVNLAADMDPVEVKNLGVWVYNSSANDITLRMWIYKGAGLSDNAELGSGLVAKANSWSYIRIGFTAASVRNFQIADFTNSGVNLVFDDICLF